MFSILKKFFNKKLNNTFLRIFTFMSIPIIVCIIFFTVNNIYYVNQFERTSINNYTNELNTFLRNIEKDLDSIEKNAKFLTFDSSFRQIFTSDSKPTAQELDVTTTSISSLKNFVSSSSIIESVALVNRTAEFVLTNTGLYDMNEYFSSVFQYKDYSYEYWRDYREAIFSIQNLPPTPVSLSNYEETQINKNVIPIVFVSLSDLKTHNLLIVNIDISSIFDELSTYQFTPAASFYMLNKFTLEYFSNDGHNFPINDTSLTSLMTSEKNIIEDNIKINGKKHILLSASGNNSVWGYSYIVTIPRSDINIGNGNIYIVLIIAIVLLAAIFFLLTYYGSKKIYHPIESIASMVGIQPTPDSIGNSDLISSIQNSISDIIYNNQILKENLSTFLPLSQEKYLIDIINGNTPATSEDFEKLAFKHPYYVSIMVHLVLSNRFFDTTDSFISPQQLQHEIYKAIQSIFSQNCDTFVLPSAGNVLYMILNVKTPDCMDIIAQSIKSAKDLFIADKDYLNLSFACGNIYEGINGLKRSHDEALLEFSKLSNEIQIQISTDNKEDYSLDLNSENILINYLIAGYADKAKIFLEDILKDSDTLSPIARNQLYTDLANTLFKVMNIKKIPYFSASSGSNAEIIMDLLSKSNEEIKQFYINIIDKISENMEVSNTKININDVIDYVNTHFTEDLYLESLAQNFNTTPKYISKRIKQYLNISFKDYLAQLRIDYAKNLLENSDIKISELAEKCGFYNRSTFIRTFKIKSGLTPSEYRRLNRKK